MAWASKEGPVYVIDEDEPVYGLRVMGVSYSAGHYVKAQQWRLLPDAEKPSGLLQGIYKQVIYPDGKPLVAQCLASYLGGAEKHDPPSVQYPCTFQHGCGIHAFYHPNDPGMKGLWRCFDGVPRIFCRAIVKGWGRCMSGTSGFRIEYAQVVAVTEPTTTGHGMHNGTEVCKCVAMTKDIGPELTLRVAEHYPSVAKFRDLAVMLANFPTTAPPKPLAESSAA